jgi:hypothetical protein
VSSPDTQKLLCSELCDCSIDWSALLSANALLNDNVPTINANAAMIDKMDFEFIALQYLL